MDLQNKKCHKTYPNSKELQNQLGFAAASHQQQGISRDGIHSANTCEEPDRDTDDDALRVVIASHLLRCGKQVKLVLGHEPDGTKKANPQLVDMIVKTRRWYEGLTSRRYPTLRSIAAEEQCDKSYVSRLLSIAFLAPDIVESILTGDHAATFTPERLRKACPLPLRWEEQRAMLLD